MYYVPVDLWVNIGKIMIVMKKNIISATRSSFAHKFVVVMDVTHS